MRKSEIIEQVGAALRMQLERTVNASQDAREHATNAESRAESKYDTQAIETSYLAAGLASRAEDLMQSIQAFGNTVFPEFAPESPIAVGALVDVEFEGERSLYLLAVAGAGLSCNLADGELTVLSPTAPLAKKLMGMKARQGIPEMGLKVISVK